MRATRALLPIAAIAAVAAAAATGCQDDSGTGACTDYAPPAGFDATKPTVTFSKDVMDVFVRSCAFTSCHGASTGAANGVFLGRDPARVYAAIVGVKGSELPAMPFVTPGRPRESYLMHKMDG